MEASSTSRTRRQYASTSRLAPWTWGAQRSEYGSWTAWVECRWLASSGEPASSRRRFAAEASWPGCGRIETTRSSYARSVPSSASTDSAQARSAALASSSASASARASSACIGSVPLMRVSPSFGARVSGASPASASSSAAGRPRGSSPGRRSRPSPTSGSATAASWARSPDAPTEPLAGTTGSRSRASSSSRRSGSSGRQPDAPAAMVRARSSSSARTASSGSGGPTPAAWLRMQRELHPGEVVVGDGDVGERAEAGGDAVDDGAALDGVGHHGPGGRHPVGDCRGEHGAGATAGDVDDVGERETVAVDGDRAHLATVLPVPSAACRCVARR